MLRMLAIVRTSTIYPHGVILHRGDFTGKVNAMTFGEAKALADKFLDKIGPDLMALRQELLEHDYRLTLYTDETGMFDFYISKLPKYPLKGRIPKAKQSRKAKAKEIIP